MEKLLGLGVVAMIVACVVVGARLLLLSARTREMPELLMGVAFVLMGGVGYPLAIAARGGPGGIPTAGLLNLGLVFQNLACLAICAMTWQTYRSSSRLGAGICIAVGLGFVASVSVAVATGDPDGGAAYYLGFALRAASFGWAAWESHRYAGLLARRLRLGLVDPVVVDRFRLWTISTAGILLGFGVFLVGRLTTESVATAPWVLAATSVVSLISAATMWLAFTPPDSYLRRVRARHVAASV